MRAVCGLVSNTQRDKYDTRPDDTVSHLDLSVVRRTTVSTASSGTRHKEITLTVPTKSRSAPSECVVEGKVRAGQRLILVLRKVQSPSTVPRLRRSTTRRFNKCDTTMVERHKSSDVFSQ